MFLLFAFNCVAMCCEENHEIRIIMVDKSLNFEYLNNDVSPIIENDHTLVPIRAIAEKLKFKVEWDARTQIIRLYHENHSLQLTIGSEVAIADSNPIIMPVAPKIINDRTLIPLRFVAEFFQEQVVWLEGNDSNYYIWISDLELLNNNDVDVINNDNYYVLYDSPEPYYALKTDGETARGVKIGDDYDNVIQKYGEPHKQYTDTTGKMRIDYLTPFFPCSDSGSFLIFYLINNKVVSVEIDSPN